MTRHEKVFFCGAAVIAVIIVAGGFILALIGCSGKDETRTIIQQATPTVPIETVTCKDFCGQKPDEEVRIDRALRSTKYCFAGTQCYFDCPPKVCR